MDADLGNNSSQEAADKKAEAEQKADTPPMGETDGNRIAEKEDRLSLQGILCLVGVVCVGIIALLVYASQCTRWPEVASVGLVVAGAALLFGGLLGFLFGIPRTVAADPKSPGTAASSYRNSTDLEQIADWLTKILVGVGLTQIASIPSKMARLGGYLKPALGGSEPFAVGLSVYFALCGFLIGYLWTRIYLIRVLKGSDAAADALASAIAMSKATAEAFAKRGDERKADDDARACVSQQLSLEAGLPTAEPHDLKDKIKKATISKRGEIFFEAVKFRSANWKNKNKLKLVIPIFEALIASDSEDQYPEYHGQLGWALRDAEESNDYTRAFNELDTAIKMHAKLKKSGEPAWFKFQRAICRILLDKSFAARARSDDKTIELINDDLDTARKGDPVLMEAMAKEEVLKNWRALNP